MPPLHPSSDSPTLRWIQHSELGRIAEIDRTEEVRTAYALEDGQLRTRAVTWDIPRWESTGTGEWTIAYQVACCREHLDAGGVALGAFVADRLVGLGVLRPDVAVDMWQLAFLYVTRPARRQGISSALLAELAAAAVAGGARRLYVSSSPTESAVGFYRRHGFAPTAEPVAALHALEPEDIHMVLDLTGSQP